MVTELRRRAYKKKHASGFMDVFKPNFPWYLAAMTEPRQQQATRTRLDRSELRKLIRDVPDFPRPGIIFRDITPLLLNPAAFRSAVQYLVEPFRDSQIDVVAAAEARGFVFAAPAALELEVGFVPIRKPGKLPHDTLSLTYELEYGTDTIEMHRDAVGQGHRILLIDDVLATGGTMEACCRLVEQAGGEIVGCAFLLELGYLHGRRRLEPYPVHAVLTLDG